MILDYLLEKIYIYDNKIVLNFYFSDDKRKVDFEQLNAKLDSQNKFFEMFMIETEGSSSAAPGALESKQCGSGIMFSLFYFSDSQQLKNERKPRNEIGENQECVTYGMFMEGIIILWLTRTISM